MKVVGSASVVVSAVIALLSACGCGRVINDGDDQPPTAAAGADVTAEVGVIVNLDGSASDDDGGITLFAWDFGDGTAAEGVSVSHAWTSAGGYVATLSVSDEFGQSSSDSVVVRIVDPALVARIVVTPAAATVGESVSFDSTTSFGPALISTASWRFGDGASADTPVASHVYAAAGTFTVRLTVTDADSASAEAQVDVVIAAANVAGTWDVVAGAFACGSYSVAFPDDTLVLTQAGIEVTALGGNGRTYTGAFAASGLPLRGSATIATGGCGNAVVDIKWRAALTAPDSLSGIATAFFDLAVPCQCTAAWNLSATRRR